MSLIRLFLLTHLMSVIMGLLLLIPMNRLVYGKRMRETLARDYLVVALPILWQACFLINSLFWGVLIAVGALG